MFFCSNSYTCLCCLKQVTSFSDQKGSTSKCHIFSTLCLNTWYWLGNQDVQYAVMKFQQVAGLCIARPSATEQPSGPVLMSDRGLMSRALSEPIRSIGCISLNALIGMSARCGYLWQNMSTGQDSYARLSYLPVKTFLTWCFVWGELATLSSKEPDAHWNSFVILPVWWCVVWRTPL